jgi:hypothetical protein
MKMLIKNSQKIRPVSRKIFINGWVTAQQRPASRLVLAGSRWLKQSGLALQWSLDRVVLNVSRSFRGGAP